MYCRCDGKQTEQHCTVLGAIGDTGQWAEIRRACRLDAIVDLHVYGWYGWLILQAVLGMGPSNEMGAADSTSLPHAWAEARDRLDRTKMVATYSSSAVAGDLGLVIHWASMWLGAARHEGSVTPCCCTPLDRAASVAGAGITHHQANSCPSLPTRPFRDKHTPKLPLPSSSIYLSA